MRRCALTVLLAIGALLGPPTRAPAATPAGLKHVFIVTLENKNFESTFGPSSEAPYLAKTLRARGNLLTQYHGTGHFSLGNYITMISGQSENPATQSDCQFFTAMLPGTLGADGQSLGSGCVYPAAVKTIADQLTARGLTWKGYMEDMGADPSREAAVCGHPAMGSRDGTQSATASDQYATRHDPFVYFRSIIDSPSCARNVVNLSRLTTDLKSVSTTPSYTFITPDLCSDGHDETCVNPGQKGGYQGIDEFLKVWAPRIMASPAYRQGGALVITFDESESGAEAAGFVPPGPNTPQQGIQGPGGGRTGTLVISPYSKPGSNTSRAYNHYSLLRTTEDVFGLGHLGYAARSEVAAFGSDVFNGPGPASCSDFKVLRAASARRSGRHGVRFGVGARGGRKVSVRVYQQSRGRRVLRPRLVTAFRHARSFRWNGTANRGGRRVRDGYFVVRFTAAGTSGRREVRRTALVRRQGRFSASPPGFARRSSCGALAAYRLSGPSFGGRGRGRLRIAYRLNRAARVAVRVTRGRRTVKRFAVHRRRAGRAYRLALSAGRLRRASYKVRITVRTGSGTLRAALVSRRL